MTIEEIKQALREMRSICTAQTRCADCPLAVDGVCPVRDDDGERVDYPEFWKVDFDD